MPVTFLHTADWQLGKPYGSVEDPDKRAILRQQRLETIDRLGAIARQHEAAFILVAGDLFDSPCPDRGTVSAACAAIGRLGVPVIAIPGNHDHGGAGGPWQQKYFLRERDALASNLTVLTEPGPLVLDQAVIFPAPLRRRHEMTDPTAWIRAALDDPEPPADLPRIILAHGSVQGFSSSTDDDETDGPAANQIDPGRLPEAGFDYLALGDWHGTKQVGPKAWYAGTPEIDRFPKGEANDPGNLLIVRAARGADPVVEKTPSTRFRWHRLAFRFAEDDDLARLDSRLTGLLGDGTDGALLELELDGALGLDASLQLAALLETRRARLLRLKLADRSHVAPSATEIESLTERREDPLIARVADRLLAESRGDGGEADTARIALRELFAACR